MGIVVVCDTELAEDSGLVISHASSAVRKKNPDRTLSVDYRILSDLRQINLGDPREDFYPVEVVRLSEIISRILKLTRQFPTLPVLMTKRDIASASRRILLRPVLVQIFTTDIPGSAFARNSDVFFGHLAMPFGWVASPAYFKLHTDAISAMHHYYRPDRCLLSGGERFSSFMYVGDCMLIECPVGNRLKASVECWEWACKQILDDDSINLEKKRIEGNWSQTATLLGFEINTAEMSAQLPAEKIEQARVLVLTDELAPVNYGVTVKTLKQLRGLCAHWLNCNLFWHFLCQPIDLLLSHASESGAMICCGETEIWLSFFNALTLTRSMAESESDWGMLFKCGLERLQVMHERLSGTVENPDAVWTSGDATMAKMAGVNWRRKEFPQLAPEDLLADFHQGQLRAYNIGEIELMTAVGIAVFWADIWKGRQIILLVTDNQNTFSWLGDRSAKKGLAHTRGCHLPHMVRGKWNRSVSFYLRSLRNIRPDFITRESGYEVHRWAESSGFTQAEKPWRWPQFMAYAPNLDWLEDRVVYLPRHLKFDTLNVIGKVCEWLTRSGISIQVFQQLGLDYCAVDGMHISDDYKPDSKEPWMMVFGAARRKGDLHDSRSYLQESQYEIVVMMTPAEVEDEIRYAYGFWSQRWRCDSAEFGDVMAGTWNIYVQSKKKYANLDFAVPGRMLSSLRRCFGDHGLKFLDNPTGVPLVRPLENSIGRTIIIIRRANGEQRLSPDSHIPPYSRKTAETEEVAWPVLDQAYRQPKLREKLLALGAHRAWVTAETEGTEQILALWKTYHVELLRTLLFEIFQDKVGEFKAPTPAMVRKPIWQRDNTRVGGYEKLDSIVDSPTGYKSSTL